MSFAVVLPVSAKSKFSADQVECLIPFWLVLWALQQLTATAFIRIPSTFPTCGIFWIISPHSSSIVVKIYQAAGRPTSATPHIPSSYSEVQRVSRWLPTFRLADGFAATRISYMDTIVLLLIEYVLYMTTC